MPALRPARSLVFALAALLLALTAARAAADCTSGPRAWLSWSSTSVQSDLADPGALTNLFVRLEGATSFKGAEIDLTWTPLGDDSCYAHIGTIFKTSADCSYLNRGLAVPVVITEEPGAYHVAWANDKASTGCESGGNAVLLQFAFDGCPTTPGCFTLHAMSMLDEANHQSTVTVCGSNATVLGGGGTCALNNREPVFAPTPDYSIRQGSPLTFSVSATDPDGDPLTYSALALPPGATFTGRTFTWDSAVLGEYDVTFVATDTHGAAARDTSHISVTASGVNRPPVLDPVADVHLYETQTVTITLHATDPDGDPLTYAASPLPPGATLTGPVFSWTPSTGQAGTYTVTFTASDPQLLSDSDDATITVDPVIGSNDDATAALSWGANAILSHLADPQPTQKLFVRVTGAGAFAGGELTLNWAPFGSTTCLNHSSTQYRKSGDCTYLNRGVTTPIVTSDVPGEFAVTWSNTLVNTSCDEGGNAVVVYLDMSTCPTIDACFTLTSLRLIDALGNYTPVTVTGATAIVNNGGDRCGEVDLPPVFRPADDQVVTEGQTLTFSVMADDPDGDSLTYSTGPLPPGATFGGQVFSWMPASGQNGTYEVVFYATDPFGAIGSDAVTVTVLAGASLVYVDQSSPCSACDGRSWASAVHTIAEGLELASAFAGDSVLVAEGRYFELGLLPPNDATVLGGYPQGGGIRDIASHFTIVQTPVPDDAAPIFKIAAKRVTLDGLIGTGARGGSNVLVIAGDDVTVRNMILAGNGGLDSAVVSVLGGSHVTLERVLITANSITNQGRAIVFVAEGADVAITNCTVSHDSTAYPNPATGLVAAGAVTVTNSIFWGLKPYEQPTIRAMGTGSIAAEYSDVGGGFPGAGNISERPLFCSPRDRDLTLHESSPLIGAGKDGATIGAYDVGCGGTTPPGDDPPFIDTSPWKPPYEPTAAGPRAIPARTALLGVRPTLAARTVTIAFSLHAPADVAVDVYDAGGALVGRIVRETLAAGTYERAWDVRRIGGRRIAAGAYLVRFHAGAVTETRRAYVMP